MFKRSSFFRIDLHIHTALSKTTKINDYKGKFDVETLYQKITENKVKILSLTDHNVINVSAYEEYYSKYKKKTDPLLLLGVELDITVKSKSYHSLLIFDIDEIAGVRRISKKLEALYEKNKVEITKRTITINEIVDLFNNEDFFFIPHAGNKKSIIDGYKGSIKDAQQMVLLMQSAFEKVPEKAIDNYNKGFDTVLSLAFQGKYDLPYIQFSDNHNINKYPHTHMGGADSEIHDFYYLKGNKNYESIRLAFIDPKSRIKTSAEIKQVKERNDNYIHRLSIDDSAHFNKCDLLFSPHLNTIIGGRSSGKSLLLNIIGTKVDRVNAKDIYNDFHDDSNILIKTKKTKDFVEIGSIDTEIIYISQGDIVNYFEKRNLKDLARKSGKYDTYDEKKQLFSELKSNLDTKISDLISIYSKIYDNENGNQYILHDSTIQNILSDEFIFHLDEEKLDDYNIEDEINDAKELIDLLKENIADFKANDIYDFSSEDLEIITSFRKLLRRKAKLLDTKDSINDKRLSFIENVCEKLKSLNDKLNSSSKQKVADKLEYKNLIKSISSKFENARRLVIKSRELCIFQIEHSENIPLNDNTSLILESKTDQKTEEIIIDGLKGGDVDYSLFINLLDLLSGDLSIKHHTDNDGDKLNKKIKVIFSDIYDSLDNPIDYLQYSDSTTSLNNSPGYNSEKYLEILLNKSMNKIIIIDQPEDNLGNNFISEKLVEMIRKLKMTNQIILVTHNPAIVVYGDSESIIISENMNNKISYKQIVLEDKDAQKMICSLLDGGEYIFNNRSEKYNIKRILEEA